MQFLQEFLGELLMPLFWEISERVLQGLPRFLGIEIGVSLRRVGDRAISAGWLRWQFFEVEPSGDFVLDDFLKLFAGGLHIKIIVDGYTFDIGLAQSQYKLGSKCWFLESLTLTQLKWPAPLLE